VARIRVVYFKDVDGSVPVLEWLAQLGYHTAVLKAHARLALLEEMGNGLRRPVADSIGNGLYELRWRSGTVNYRVIYFFYGQQAAVAANGLTKEARLPAADVDRALRRKRAFEASPEMHTYTMEVDDA